MKKMEEIRQQSSENLLKQVDDLKQELFDLRFQQATGNLENPARIREIRKTIARIKTVLTERQNQD
ncbi:MAG: 50S ribosomal protein L29 [Erysipelotrichaceae bacterium]